MGFVWANGGGSCDDMIEAVFLALDDYDPYIEKSSNLLCIEHGGMVLEALRKSSCLIWTSARILSEWPQCFD